MGTIQEVTMNRGSIMRRLALGIAIFAALISVPRAELVAESDPRQLQMVGPEEKLLRLELNKGQLVRLARPAVSVFIADPKVADVQVKSPTLVYVFAKQAGETTLFAVDGNDRLLANLRIGVSHNLSGLKDAMSAMLPGSFVDVSSVGDAVVLSGVVGSGQVAEDARLLAARFAGGEKNVINRISVRGPNQVNLRVRVAEVNRSVLKRIGINWEALMSVGSFAFGLATNNAVLKSAAQYIVRNNSTDSFFGGTKGGPLSINGVLDALENEGLVTVLAEPNLTAVSGETASFLAGGEFPMMVPQSRDLVTIEFKKFGVALAFTPTLMDGGRISLKVRPEVSQLSTTGEVRLNNNVIPSLATRRAETTVELSSGQSFAIAGLIQNNITHELRKFPGLGDVPILGTLFRSDRFKRDETELVIIVTPYVVRPVASAGLQVPTDGLVMPSDRSRVENGETQKVGLRNAEPAIRQRRGKALVGQAGFTLE
jgi:pilus assembly protein CpaC